MVSQSQNVIDHVDSWPYLDQDPFADPVLPNVRGAEPTVHPSPHARDNLVTVPTPAASIRSSVDRMSMTTSSTLPPSYCTHRPTYRTASDVLFSSHERIRNTARTAAGGHGPTSYQAWTDRRSRHHPRKSVDGGVRLEGGPVDLATGRGSEQPPRYREKL
ncbi:hypothetical protein GSI_08543 [Ganoderma sinense ZZ0214-1]|uniref:Uncharacterized protein n=1 Tax=Ganoderma sinense ZZ0214-1 TaxID=1077348 RepID=A0A2G8S437_9APHY|nr:hypothetical protein GSI_08543 [Ganoderma sinense ZZ0214-1]